MTKKKLLITTDCFLPRWDGIARFLAELIPHLKRDYEITVLAPDFEGQNIKIPGVEIKRIPLIGFQWGDYPPAKFRPWRIKKLVKEADIVFNQSIGSIGMFSVLYSRKFRKPLVSFIHSIEWDLVPKSASKLFFAARYFVKIFARWMHNKASMLIVPSEDTESVLKYARIS